MGSMLQPVPDRCLIHVKIDKFWRDRFIAEHGAIGLLQGGTSQDDRVVCGHLLLQLIVQPLQPRRPILVVERNSMLHLFDIGLGMEIIRIQKDPVQFLSHFHADSRLPGTGYTHENYCLRMVLLHMFWGVQERLARGTASKTKLFCSILLRNERVGKFVWVTSRD